MIVIQLMMDWNRAIAIAVRTGKVSLGFKETMEAIRCKKAKMIVFAINLPDDNKRKIQSAAKISGIPLHQHGGSSIDLGVICGKTFTVSALAIKESGDSDILKQGEEKSVE